MAAPERPIFGIFEGGGAKGIAHIGALAAAEKNGLQFYGVAGASAGAVIAALVSVGFAADEIMHPTDRTRNILAANGQTPVTVLGVKAWKAFSRMEKGLHRASRWVGAVGALGGLAVAPRTTLSVRRVMARHGHFETGALRELINTVLRNQLRLIHAERSPAPQTPERITFADLDYDAFPRLRPLKIVATDLTTGELMVFDRSTPAVEVAEAVAASIAIPLVFKPVIVASYDRKRVFVDGGLVSNLPTWVFAEEKLAFERADPRAPPIPVVAFTLKPKPDAPPRKGRPKLNAFENHLLSVASAAVSGSQQVSRRFVEDLVIVPLETELDVLDFGVPWATLVESYQDGLDCAEKRLRHALFLKPDRVRKELAGVHSAILQAMNARRARLKLLPIERLRANIAEPFGARSYRITYGFNMADDADDRLLLDRRGRGVPQAYEQRNLVFAPVGAAWTHPAQDYMTKYERALVRAGIRSLICVPVFESVDVWESQPRDRPDPAGILSIDSDADLADDFDDPDIKDLLAVQSTLLFSALKRGADDVEA